MKKQKISSNTITRLSIYLRQLQRLADQHVDYISSSGLVKDLNIKDDQFRKDLSFFGQFGRAGKGYNVKALKNHISRILGIKDKVQNAVLIGAGNLGSALLRYKGFRQFGFEIILAFDNNPAKIGKAISNKKVETIDNLDASIKKFDIKIGIIATPASVAQEVTDKLIKTGVLAILNFAPVQLNVPTHIKLQNVDLAMELEKLSYYLAR